MNENLDSLSVIFEESAEVRGSFRQRAASDSHVIRYKTYHRPKELKMGVVYPEVRHEEAVPRFQLPRLSDLVPSGRCEKCGEKVEGRQGTLEIPQIKAKVDIEDVFEEKSSSFLVRNKYRIKGTLFVVMFTIAAAVFVVGVPIFFDKAGCSSGELECPPKTSTYYDQTQKSFCCGMNSTCCMDGRGVGSCCTESSLCCGGKCCSSDEQCCGSICIPKGYRCCASTGIYCGLDLKCCNYRGLIHCCSQNSTCTRRPPYCSQ